eukprot:TRINITY_DN11500_c0_g1_i2.p2 TRINITY_DN11500_c0_g1~~TRINITY_DN11500_c0_g1_i2.p2  ORF type:complete len:204 (+),score=15.37 TRINITY_DN11500_c0_g1_i2:1298-1909(+)
MACWRHGSAEITPLLDEIASGGQRYKDNQRQWLPYLAIALSAAFAFGTFWLLSAGVYALAEEDVTFQLLLLKDDVQFPLFSGNFLFISVTIWATLRVALSVTAHLHFKGLDEQALTSIVFSPTILAINACLCTMVVAADAVLLAQRSEHWGLDCVSSDSRHPPTTLNFRGHFAAVSYRIVKCVASIHCVELLNWNYFRVAHCS